MQSADIIFAPAAERELKKLTNERQKDVFVTRRIERRALWQMAIAAVVVGITAAGAGLGWW